MVDAILAGVTSTTRCARRKSTGQSDHQQHLIISILESDRLFESLFKQKYQTFNGIRFLNGRICFLSLLQIIATDKFFTAGWTKKQNKNKNTMRLRKIVVGFFCFFFAVLWWVFCFVLFFSF